MKMAISPTGAVQAVPTGSDTYSSAMADAQNYIGWILGALRPYLKGPVLEIGVGHGSYAPILREYGQYTGCDFDPASVDLARGRFPDLVFEVADITALDFPARFHQRFASIVCSNVIEHIERDDVAISNLVGALAPGGHLLIVVPAFQSLMNDLDRLAGHLRRYRTRDLRGLFEATGVTPVQVDYFNPIGGLGWWVNRILPYKSLNDDAVNAQIRAFDRYAVPLSRMIDPLTRRFFGQSVVAIGRKP